MFQYRFQVIPIAHPYSSASPRSEGGNDNNSSSSENEYSSDMVEFERGWFVNEADELVNMDYMKLAEKMSDVCSSTGGSVT